MAEDTAPIGAPRATGILPYQAIVAMRRGGEILAETDILPEQLQPASVDLRLGTVAYRVRASFLPGPEATVAEKISQLDGYAIDLAGGAVLEKGCVYVVPLLESLALGDQIAGLANPKSSTGRLDILTRLITDRSAAFDRVERGYHGPLYVEIAPRTFSVVVRTGSRLNQLRFRRGTPAVASSELQRLHDEQQIVMALGDENKLGEDGMLRVTVDLGGSGDASLIGFRARKHTDRIDVDNVGYYDPREFWEPLHAHREPRIILDQNDFYILKTRESVGVPPDYAAEMMAYDTTVGEFRVHYAGFFDPGFGWDNAAGGSRAVLEVRSHEVPFLLEHGQTVGWLRYEPMAGRPDKLYGRGIGSNYQNQGLALAKQFKPLA
ncbi:MAG TPA: 2'-deoxycytidine 5'-triphosphate deaminase [Alphaproteobacteria bacterium]|nr:2'-deoxycytidine 5'-triphosphate deaminase [Alphaproteobacteria bacterium]